MHATALRNIEDLLQEFHARRTGKDALLTLLEEAELPEAVYNSNAIENSTLTLDETERILLHQEIPPFHTQREVFEAVNLAAVMAYLNEKARRRQPLTEDLLRVGRHVAPGPERVPRLMAEALDRCRTADEHPLQRIVAFHLEFERIHPFCDGNGRVGRALLHFQLKAHGYPPIIVRNKEKREYYAAFQAYDDHRSTKELERMLVRLLKESLHKRLAYLRGEEIVPLSTLGKEFPERAPQGLANAAKKQSLPAFREKGRWKVGRRMFREWLGGAKGASE